MEKLPPLDQLRGRTLGRILTKMGLLNASILRSKWKIAVVAIFVTAAVITPTTDVFNMAILAAPMMLLYAVSIWISALAKRA